MSVGSECGVGGVGSEGGVGGEGGRGGEGVRVVRVMEVVFKTQTNKTDEQTHIPPLIQTEGPHS